MIAHAYDKLERDGWILFAHRGALADAETKERAIAVALDAARGRAIRRVRRSRRGETWLARLTDSGPDVFVKVLASARGVEAFKCALRGSRALQVAAVSDGLNRTGIAVPRVILFGQDGGSGREILAIERAPGYMVPRWLRGGRDRLAFKRALLYTLGAQVAAMHRAGFVHGDLTPFNVVIAGDREPPLVSFIDHERTRRPRFIRTERQRLRNLVQLGRFNLTGLSETDRMRVWDGYARAMGLGCGRSQRKRLVRMLLRRRSRDAASDKAETGPARAPRAQWEEGR